MNDDKPSDREPAQPNPSPDTSKSTARRSRRWWWIGGIVGGLIVILLLVVLALPTLLSTGPGQRLLTRYVNSTIAGTVQIEQLRLAWFGGQSASGITLSDPAGERVVSVRRVDAPQLRLASVLLGSSNYGPITVDADTIHLRQAAGEPTNLQLALQPTQPQPEPEPDEPTQLDGDLSVELDFTADRVTYEAPDVEQVELTDVAAGIEIAELRRIVGRVHSNLVHGNEPGRIDLTFNVNDAFTADGEPQIGQASVQANGELAGFPLDMADRLAGQEGRLAALLGNQLNATFTAAGPVRALTVELQASSPHLTTNMALVGDENTIRAREGSQLQLQVTPEAFAAWMAPPEAGEAPATTLVQPFTVNLELVELTLPRHDVADVALADGSLNLEANVDDVVLDTAEQGRITLGQPQLRVQSARLGNSITASLRTQAMVGEVSEPVSAEAVVRQLFAEDQPMQATVEATALPMTLADALADLDGALALTIGETLSTTMNLTRTPAGDMTFAGQVNAPQLAGSFEGGYAADGTITLQTPQPMVLQLSPQAFERWAAGEEGPTLALEENAELALNVEQLVVAILETEDENLQSPAQVNGNDEVEPAEPATRLDPERTRIALNLSSPLLRLRDLTTNERFTMEQARLNVRGDDLRQLLEVDLEAVIEQLRDELNQPAPQQPPQQEPQAPPQQQPPTPDAAATGRITSQTRIAGLLSERGDVQPAASQIQSNTTLTSVPSAVLDALGGQGGSLAALLGPRTSAEAYVDYDGDAGGTVDLDLQSDNATAHLPGRITSEQTLELRDDATATLQITPELGRVMLSTINPLLQAESGERPARLVLRSENFSMPLSGFDMQTVRANASLDLGTMQLHQGDLAQALFAALSAVGGRFDPGQTYDAQFAPFTLALDDGVLSYDDLAMTISNLQLGFRGQVNYETQQFNLVMGLPAASLGRVVSGLERAVGPNYELEVPITGTFDAPRLDTSAMVRELTQLALRAGLREAVGGNGGRGGGLLDIITGGSPQRNTEPPAEDDAPDDTAETAPDANADEEADETEERNPVRDLLDIFR